MRPLSDDDPVVIVHPGRAELADAAAARLVVTLIDAVAARGVAHMSLTGGSMGSALVAAVTRVPARMALDWSRVHAWWGDERYLPAGSAERNDSQNDHAGLGSLGLRARHVHRVLGPDASTSAEESASRYGAELHANGDGGFDVVILGVGPDGHVASLFPHHPAAATTGADTVAVHNSPKPPAVRVSLTRECLQRSREVWFVVGGPDKADAVRRGVTGAPFDTTPAAHVHGREHTRWLLDAEAAGALPR
ncbi:MAG: 6-phosphogluconolactonase [Dermatophilaceae bacterium]